MTPRAVRDQSLRRKLLCSGRVVGCFPKVKRSSSRTPLSLLFHLSAAPVYPFSPAAREYGIGNTLGHRKHACDKTQLVNNQRQMRQIVGEKLSFLSVFNGIAAFLGLGSGV